MAQTAQNLHPTSPTSFHHGITYTSYQGNTFALKFNTSGEVCLSDALEVKLCDLFVLLFRIRTRCHTFRSFSLRSVCGYMPNGSQSVFLMGGHLKFQLQSN